MYGLKYAKNMEPAASFESDNFYEIKCTPSFRDPPNVKSCLRAW